MRESDLVSGIIKLCYPILKLYRANAGTFRSDDGKHVIKGMPKGFPDLFGVILADKAIDGKPVPVFIEAKVHPNKPSPEQIGFIDEHRAGGCCAGVCYTVAEAWRLIRPHIRKELDTYSDDALERWDKLSG